MMTQESIHPKRNLLTKAQREQIGRLGAEWAVLDSEENLLFGLERELWEKLGPSEKRPPELVELDRQQIEISKRKREISADFIAVEKGGSDPKRPLGGRRPDVYVQLRNLRIRSMRDRSNEDICKVLDLELAQSGALPFGFPESWFKNYGVKTYCAAYRHLGCKKLVQRLLSGAKKRY